MEGGVVSMPSKRYWILATVLAPAVWLAACSSSQDVTETSSDRSSRATESRFPERAIRWTVGSSAGGGFDTSTRQFAPHFERALGGTFRVENLPGGNVAVAAGVVARDGGDCYTILTTGVPHLLFSFMTQRVPFTYDDFYPIGQLTIEPGVIRVRTDAPWATLAALVEDARKRPRRVRVSVSGYTSNNYLGLLDIQEATGVEFNIIPYPGGNEARTAVLSGEVDATHAGLFNSLHISDGSRVLAVHQDVNAWPAQTNSAPTVNEELGTTLRPNGGSYGVFVSRECRNDHADRYQRLVEAFELAVRDEEYIRKLDDVGEKGRSDFIGAVQYDAEIREEIERLSGLIGKHAELQLRR
jgi:putative tricarboxylic transport membrane protein